MKRLQIPQKLVCEKLYVREIAAINLSKIYLLKKAKKTFQPISTCSNSTIEILENGRKYVQS